MIRPILQAEGLSVRFGGLLAVDRLDLSLQPGQLAGLIGPNGAGKTTAFNLLTGRIRPSGGRVMLEGKVVAGEGSRLKPSHINKLGLARTFQNIRLFGQLSVFDNVLVGFHGRLKANFISAIFRLPSYRREGVRIRKRVEDLLDLVELRHLAWETADNLAYGQQRLLEIARALATEPRALLLDEPAAGMNPQESAALAGLVRRIRDEMNLSILLIEHDMSFVMNLCEELTVLDHGSVIARGRPREVQDDPKVIEAYLGVEHNGNGEGGHA